MGSKRVGGFKDKEARARRQRRGVPIHAYVGANGSGKTLAAVYDTLPSLLAGRRVLSTVHLLDWTTPDVAALHQAVPEGSTARCNPEAHHPLFTELCDYRQLLEAERCDVILDEVTGVASSRESATMPAEIANLLVQLRRRDLTLRWTAPAWGRADVIIRECSQAVTTCRGFMREASWSEHEIVNRSVDDETGEVVEVVDVLRERNLWPARRLFMWRTYDAVAFDEWDSRKAEDIKPMARQFFRRRGSLAEAAYDTLAAVSGLASISEHGRCLDCGGQRTRPKCTCRTASLQTVAREMGRVPGSRGSAS